MTELALVGAAHIHSPAYIDTILSHPQIQVRYVWDHDAGRARSAADRLGARVIDSLDRIWRDERIVGVISCVETRRQPDVLLGAIDAGKAIFAEKPMTRTWTDARAIAAKASAAGTVFQTGYFLRYHPSIRSMRDAVLAGSFGRVNRIHARLTHPGALDGWFDSEWAWMADASKGGPDAFHDLGIHLVDLMMWINGPIDRVIYDTDAAVARYPGMDTSGAGLVKFANGSLGLIETSWADQETPSSLAIEGTEGSVYLGSDHASAHGPVATRHDWSNVGTLSMSAREGLAPFLDRLSGRPANLVDIRDAAQTIAVMDAFSTARRQSAWASVPRNPA